jgi:hypothetical protein
VRDGDCTLHEHAGIRAKWMLAYSPRGRARAALAKAEQAGGDLDSPTDSSSDDEPAGSSSPLRVLPSVRPVEGNQLRVFARGEWKQTLVLEASDGVARVQFPGAGQRGDSAETSSGEVVWVDVRSLGEGMIAGFERVSTPTKSRPPVSTPAAAGDGLGRAGRIAETLRAKQSARTSREDNWSQRTQSGNQSRPSRYTTGQYGSAHPTASLHRASTVTKTALAPGTKAVATASVVSASPNQSMSYST